MFPRQVLMLKQGQPKGRPINSLKQKRQDGFELLFSIQEVAQLSLKQGFDFHGYAGQALAGCVPGAPRLILAKMRVEVNSEQRRSLHAAKRDVTFAMEARVRPETRG